MVDGVAVYTLESFAKSSDYKEKLPLEAWLTRTVSRLQSKAASGKLKKCADNWRMLPHPSCTVRIDVTAPAPGLDPVSWSQASTHPHTHMPHARLNFMHAHTHARVHARTQGIH